MNIRELAIKLQEQIDERMLTFIELTKQANSVKKTLDEIEKEMASIVFELEPVESLVRHQNPQLDSLFDNLKNTFQKDDHDKPTTTNK